MNFMTLNLKLRLLFAILTALTCHAVGVSAGPAICKQPGPIISLSEERRSEATAERYINEWFKFEKCTIEQLNNLNLKEFLAKYKTIYDCAPEYSTAFNEWAIHQLSERNYRSTQVKCNQRSLVSLEILLNVLWDHINNLNEGHAPVHLTEQQQAWLKYYALSCSGAENDHPYVREQFTFCKKRELEFRILSLSSQVGADGNAGWPAPSMHELLNDFSIRE